MTVGFVLIFAQPTPSALTDFPFAFRTSICDCSIVSNNADRTQHKENNHMAKKRKEVVAKDAAVEAAVADIKFETETVAEIDSVVAEIEALEAVAADEVSVDAAPAMVEEVQADTREFTEIMDSVSEDEADEFNGKLAAALDERQDFETNKDVGNSNIQKTLKSVRGKLFITRQLARAAIACKTDAEFVNRVLHDGSRYNVYAIEKYRDLVSALGNGKPVSNAINRACIRSMFAVLDAGKNFDMEAAKAAASDKYRIADTAVADLMKGLRHTVSASTAPTQASSTMQALQTLGIVRAEGSKRNPQYKLNGTPAVQRLRDLMIAA
jgi:hypothetical protein